VSENQTPSQPADTADDDTARALQAVQVALDRRDNGGDAAPDPAPPQPAPQQQTPQQQTPPAPAPAPDRQPPASAR
jgi:hypothetical protein